MGKSSSQTLLYIRDRHDVDDQKSPYIEGICRVPTQLVQGNQDYHMNIKQDGASASISIIYKIGKYKEKRTKDVDTSRMGVN